MRLQSDIDDAHILHRTEWRGSSETLLDWAVAHMKELCPLTRMALKNLLAEILWSEGYTSGFVKPEMSGEHRGLCEVN